MFRRRVIGRPVAPGDRGGRGLVEEEALPAHLDYPPDCRVVVGGGGEGKGGGRGEHVRVGLEDELGEEAHYDGRLSRGDEEGETL